MADDWVAALEAQREQGLPPREAIYQASLLRFRPIMMTTLAALLGALIAHEHLGAEQYLGFAIALAAMVCGQLPAPTNYRKDNS